jgi:hypothetical protein
MRKNVFDFSQFEEEDKIAKTNTGSVSGSGSASSEVNDSGKKSLKRTPSDEKLHRQRQQDKASRSGLTSLKQQARAAREEELKWSKMRGETFVPKTTSKVSYDEAEGCSEPSEYDRNDPKTWSTCGGDPSFRSKETCSCLYGNPCVDQYECRDWNNRFEVAKKNGMKQPPR